ncbi:MAG TPA: NAD(P)H-dependent oxidoreductase [Caulobacteraceae bacterium]|jgi:FMN-dependent NADH-azoreductase|nr:NAD(P)H-dependent oxidoreductase [Caulobacteraceae bacterium]
MNILHIDSAVTGENSVSRSVTAAVVASLAAADPSARIVHRDLEAQPIPHLDASSLGTLRPDLAKEGPGAEQLAVSTQALEEFLGADVIVIGAPMYNFGIPSQLKAWIDRIAVAGKTFTYTAQGPKGLAGGKTVIIASSRGGLYGEGSPAAGLDFVEPYLRAVFGFVGITELSFIKAEGIAFGPDQRAAALASALEQASRAGAGSASRLAA